MFATRAPRLGALLTLALAASLGMSTSAAAQATKAEVKAKKAKEAVREKDAPKGLVDINSASAEELRTLPGIGEAHARKIIDGRPHKSLADLAGAGVPASTIEKIRPLADAKPLPDPVDVNADPLAKLETLPGVGPALAREIVAARPIAGYDDIAKLKGIGPAKLDALKGRLKFAGSAPAAKAKAEEKAAVAKKEMAKAKVEEAKSKVEEAKASEDDAKAAEAKAKAKVAKAKDAPRPAPAPGAKVNINKASKEELDSLFGIGEVRAQAIIDARPFASVEDIMKVKGIKEFEFNKIKDRITVK